MTLPLKDRIEDHLQGAAEACDQLIAGLNFEVIYINDNNRSDWEDFETKLMVFKRAIHEMTRFDYGNPRDDHNEHRTYSAKHGRLTC